nr:LINE-type retrotransposon LIb DNA [Ipomoea batatas]GMC86400.1 LINE-type retrotransposon LIb DNA [Ipomoea batatas]GME01951.1 LINE-type retrotransposon LIb DNA [Ipomoea batatas]
MLVTRKSKPPDNSQPRRQTKKTGNDYSQRGNQFGVLAEKQTPKAPARTTNNKGKARVETGSGSRGKSSSHPTTPVTYQPPNQVMGNSDHPVNRQPAAPRTRGRGGFQTASRGRGRGAGRGDGRSAAECSTEASWRSQVDNQGVFNFGSLRRELADGNAAEKLEFEWHGMGIRGKGNQTDFGSAFSTWPLKVETPAPRGFRPVLYRY